MIRVADHDALRIITLDRPNKANALTADMLESLIDAVQTPNGHKALILTGTGSVFCAGADLDAARAGLATSQLWEELSGALAGSPCLTIAALNGTLAGGAFGMVLACDLRLAVESAKFFYPVMKLGFLPQPSDPKRLRNLVGPAAAKRLLMSAEKWNATEAHDLGLIDRILPAADLMAEAQASASAALGAEASHVAAIKAMI